MATEAAIYLFLTAAVAGLFAFLSIAIWVTTPARERERRDKLALLKTLAEHPGEQAEKVVEYLREEDATRAERKERQYAREMISGGLITTAAGVGLGVMLVTLARGGAWTVALIPLLVGCVLVGIGVFASRKSDQVRTGDK